MRTLDRLGSAAVGVILAGAVFLMPDTAWASPTFVQDHFRWRNDDGSETAATWKAAADTAITGVARGQNIRLRFCVSNTSASNGSGALSARLEYATATNGPWTAVSAVADGMSPFEMTATTGYADGAAATALLAGAGTFVAGKCVELPSNAGAAVTYAVRQYSNFEYCFRATAKAIGSTAYYFRVSNNGAVLNTYSRYAALTMVAGEANEAPVIKSPLTANASTQAAFSYTILASGSEPITYGATGLPAGLSRSGAAISGTATTVGTYNVGLSASSAYGTDNKTLVLTVMGNVPPVASNQAVSVVEAGEITINLAWSDPDNPLLTQHTFTIVSQPGAGTLESEFQRTGSTDYPNRYYYRAGIGTGLDSITWKCRDLANDSNVGTVTISKSPNTAPTITGWTGSNSSGRSYCMFNFMDPDAGQTLSFSLVSPPSHCTVEMPTPRLTSISGISSFLVYYTSEPGYAGQDSFTWQCEDGKDDSNIATVNITVTPSVPVPQDQTVSVKN
ncbi:MAG: Ig-like domain-containing protein, partial [Kiritimatiellae bacterium]|nr:Ig-like domain-containing protein [Kiritimatiellia bacterium]